MKIILLRGLPGCGKSTYASKMQSISKISADDFFMKDGVYQFDPTQIGNAHATCFRRCLTLAQNTKDDIVIDNTNINSYEIAPYIQTANAFNLDHEIITLWCDPFAAFSRNKHGVQITVIMQMYFSMLTNPLPAFWKHTIIPPA